MLVLVLRCKSGRRKEEAAQVHDEGGSDRGEAKA